jgi:hypothetical protein
LNGGPFVVSSVGSVLKLVAQKADSSRKNRARNDSVILFLYGSGSAPAFLGKKQVPRAETALGMTALR